jgi:hypothetical protein
MAKRKKDTQPYQMSLCESCARGTARDCAFMRERNPAVGLALMGITDADVEKRVVKLGPAEYRHRNHPDGQMILYKVRRCPHFKRGPIPPVDWDWLIAERSGKWVKRDAKAGG